MADTVKVQTIVDTSHRTALVLTNLSDGTGETAVLKANGAALNGAFRTLTLEANSSLAFFRIGELITANTSGATGVVADQDKLANGAVVIKVVSCVGTFNTGESLTGNLSSVVRIQSGAQVIPTYRFTIDRMVYSVSGGVAVLLWGGQGGGANSTVAWAASDSSDVVFPEIGGALTNDAVSPTGNLLVTTRGFVANSTYSILVDLKKSQTSYTAILRERNPIFGYPNSF